MKQKKNRIVWTKSRITAALLVTALILALTGFTIYGSGMADGYAPLFLLLAFLAGIWILLDLKFGWIYSVLLYLIAPFAALYALEHYTHVLSDLSMPILVLNLLFFYLLYGCCIFLFGSIRRGIYAATLVPMLFGLTNYFVVSFRGTPIVPWDLLSLGTAVSVADNYTFTLSWKVSCSILLFLWIFLIASKSAVSFPKRKIRFTAAAVFLLLLGVFVSAVQKSSVQSFFGMDTTLFTLNVLYRNNGIAGAFLGNLRFLNIEQPEGYSTEKVEALAAKTETKEEAENDTEYPHIIVIMDEAFSDLSVWGEFETSEEVMPFFKQLQQESVGGEVYVSVKGGNTANTEFEFLTGDTMAFLPTGSVPYQQYITSETPSLASYLKTLGYETTAIHPYNRSGWDRDTVYESFGFDQFLDKNSFDNPYRLRDYISDFSAFDKIVEQYEIGRNSGKQFIFEVTMQNHGGYSKENPGFSIYLTLPEVENKTTSVTATEKYLTLMNQTDCALQDLIEYFEQESDPVVVVMFGDHQPSDYITNVIQRICGAETDDTLESFEQGYRVPFMIWSNYGLEQKYYDGISVNYLSTILMEQAGIPKTGYQEFLSTLMEEFPIINANVYQDEDGVFHSWDEETSEEALEEYKMLQYNHLIDTKHRVTSFFS